MPLLPAPLLFRRCFRQIILRAFITLSPSFFAILFAAVVYAMAAFAFHERVDTLMLDAADTHAAYYDIFFSYAIMSDVFFFRYAMPLITLIYAALSAFFFFFFSPLLRHDDATCC